jgi:hypothetical protein
LFCSSCGNVVPNGAAYCGECGEPVQAAADSPTAAIKPEPSPNLRPVRSEPSPGPKKDRSEPPFEAKSSKHQTASSSGSPKASTTKGPLLALIALFGVALLVIGLKRESSNPTSEKPATPLAATSQTSPTATPPPPAAIPTSLSTPGDSAAELDLRVYYQSISDDLFESAYARRSRRLRSESNLAKFVEIWSNNRTVTLDRFELVSDQKVGKVVKIRLLADDLDPRTGQHSVTPWNGQVKLVLEDGFWCYDGGDFKAEVAASQKGSEDGLYANVRYGYRLRYPSDFHPQEESANGDGRTITAPDGRAEILVYGSNNIEELSLSQAYQEALAEAPLEPAYKTSGENWFVVSWLEGDKVIYLKTFQGTGASNTLRVDYPKSQSKTYDRMIERLVESFQPGDLAQSH